MNKKYFLICEALNYASLRKIAIQKLSRRFKNIPIPELEIGKEISRLVKSHWKTMGVM